MTITWPQHNFLHFHHFNTKGAEGCSVVVSQLFQMKIKNLMEKKMLQRVKKNFFTPPLRFLSMLPYANAIIAAAHHTFLYI